MSELFSHLRSARPAGSRSRALRALCLATALVMGGVLSGAVPAPAAPAKKQLMKLEDLPQMMLKASANKAAQTPAKTAATGGASRTSTRRFSLTEVDLTPGTASDDRQPSYRNDGDALTFLSNRVTNPNGTTGVGAFYHVWVMNRDGSGQRQITGLVGDSVGRSQNNPKWSPNGNQIVYEEFINDTTSQLFVIEPFIDTNATATGINLGPAEQRTFESGFKRSAIFSADGSELIYATRNFPGTDAPLPSFDLFATAAGGGTTVVRRLTGGTSDPIGDATDDLNPAVSIVSGGVLLFSSNRAIVNGTAQRIDSRRIWVMQANGLNKRQVSDPTKRTAGVFADNDDYPTTSRPIRDNEGTLSTERVAFQSNSLIDNTDTTRDLNVWSLKVDSTRFAAVENNTMQPKALLVGSFNTDEVKQVDPATGNVQGTFANGQSFNSALTRIEGVIFGDPIRTDGTSDTVPDLLVARRNRNTVDAFDGVTGALLGTFTGGFGLKTPAGMYYDGTYVYVASGIGGSTNRVHRFLARNGAPAGAGGSTTTSVFTDGGGIGTGDIGLEGVAVPPPSNSPTAFDRFLYVSVLLESKVNRYDITTGAFAGTIVFPTDGLDLPTDLKFSPDGTRLYVNSAGRGATDTAPETPGHLSIFRVTTDATTGAQSVTLERRIGQEQGVFTPEGLAIGPSGNVFVSNFFTPGQNRIGLAAAFTASGRIINRFTPNGNPLPAPGKSGALFTDDASIQGAGYMAFTPAFLASATVSNLPPAGSTVEFTDANPSTPDNPAALETNKFSSAGSFRVSGLPGSVQISEAQSDKSADREPTFARSRASGTFTSQIAFASQRQRAFTPTGLSVIPSAGVNPSGGPQNLDANESLPITPTGGRPSHDIWTTQAADFTPPILVPQAAGNQLYPVVSPGPQAPTADGRLRTFESGLSPGGRLRFAVVMQEKESGIQTVTMSMYNADQQEFFRTAEAVNDNLNVRIANERKARPVAGFTDIPMAAYDDGPPSATSKRTGRPGRELQAGAVEGDGIVYCEVVTTAPNLTGDFYMDVFVEDNASNDFRYDNVWGISTRQFVKQGTNDLFVSDYTAGQQFLAFFNDFFDGDFDDQFDDFFFGVQRSTEPVESYYLTNPEGRIVRDDGDDLDFNDQVIASTTQTTLPNVDVWRIQCRGPVPESVLASYTPTVTMQFDPVDFANGIPKNAEGEPVLPGKTKRIAVAESSVIWASPYTGGLFVGPGTLLDSEMQRRLTNFLGAGGRLFVTGPDVIFALSNAGAVENSFLTNELHTGKFAGAITAQKVTGDVGKFGRFGFVYNIADDFNPQFPRPSPPAPPTDLWSDAADNGSNSGMDIITPTTSAQSVLTTAYTVGESIVGQRVVTQRGGSGVESRLVFFTYGLEGVNRRYGVRPPFGTFGIDVRFEIASSIRRYFRTGRRSGSVFNTTTQLPIPGIVLNVAFNGNSVNVITDVNGRYEVLGIPEEGATITLARTASGDPVNEGFQPTVQSTRIDTVQDFFLTPLTRGSLSGRAVVQDDTPAVFNDNDPFANGPVLLYSVNPSSLFPNGGRFAQLTRTDAGGRYNFTQVPAETDLVVVFNPDVSDIPEESNLRSSYSGPNPSFSKRIVNIVQPNRVPVGDGFILNEGANDAADDNGRPIIISDGATISGLVKIKSGGVERAATPGTVRVSGNGFNQVVNLDAAGRYTIPNIKPTNNVVYTVTVNTGRFTRTVQVTVTRPNTIEVPEIVFLDHRIDGLVVTSTNNVDTPAAGATVTLTGQGITRTTTTGPKGGYFFGSLDAGTYTIRATTTGASGGVSVSVGNGNNAIAPTIKFNVQLVRGTVKLISNGMPARGLPGARVFLGQNGMVSNGTSGAGGVFTLNTTRTGNFNVVATFGGATSAAVPITLTPGETEENVNVLIFLQSVSGQVRLDGAALGNARVDLSRIVNGAKQFVATKQTDAAGNYKFLDLVTGTYQVTAIAAGDSAGTPQIGVPQNGKDIPAPTIALRTQKISGVVRLEGENVGGATIQLQQGSTVIQTFTPTATNGAFTFAKLSVGTYVLRAFKGDLKSTDTTVSVTRGQDVSGITLILVNQSVTGRVLVNGNAAPNANIRLKRNGNVIQTTISTTGGRYGFGDVPAGTYQVEASLPLTVGSDTGAVSFTANAGPTAVPDINLLAQTIIGRVTVNGASTSGVSVALRLTQGSGAPGANVLQTATTDGNGNYRFAGLGAGNFTTEASRNGDRIQVPVNVPRNGQTITAPVIALSLQNIVGSVTLDGSAARGAVVKLMPGNFTATTNSSGTYQFTGVNAGTYTVSTTFQGKSGSVTVSVSRGSNAVAPTIRLGTGVAPPAANDFFVGTIYHFSIPFADQTAPNAITTVAKALSVPPSSGTTVNYILRRYDAATQAYVPITDPNAIIQRGVGYAIEPKSGPVRIKRPVDDATRLPTAATTFDITLRLNPSPTSSDNGNNFIGFPFDPARADAVALWENTSFVAPAGGGRTSVTTYANLNEAVAANIVAREIYYFDGTNYVLTDRLEPFRAYFVRTYVDNVKATLRVGSTTN